MIHYSFARKHQSTESGECQHSVPVLLRNNFFSATSQSVVQSYWSMLLTVNTFLSEMLKCCVNGNTSHKARVPVCRTWTAHVVRQHRPQPWTVSDVPLSLVHSNPADVTDDHGRHRSHTDMSFLVKANIAALCKSWDLVNKCSEAVKINCPHHANSFISSAADIFNSLSTKRGIRCFRAACVYFHIDDVLQLGKECDLNLSPSCFVFLKK